MLSLISNFFTGVWSKLAALLAVVSGAFFLFIRYQAGKISKLKRENSTLKATKEIQTKQDKFKAKVINAEAEKLQEALNANSSKSKLDKLNDI